MRGCSWRSFGSGVEPGCSQNLQRCDCRGDLSAAVRCAEVYPRHLSNALDDEVAMHAILLRDSRRAGPSVRGSMRQRFGVVKGVLSAGRVRHETLWIRSGSRCLARHVSGCGGQPRCNVVRLTIRRSAAARVSVAHLSRQQQRLVGQRSHDFTPPDSARTTPDRPRRRALRRRLPSASGRPRVARCGHGS
jgi:hypothetical protein